MAYLPSKFPPASVLLATASIGSQAIVSGANAALGSFSQTANTCSASIGTSSIGVGKTGTYICVATIAWPGSGQMDSSTGSGSVFTISIKRNGSVVASGSTYPNNASNGGANVTATAFMDATLLTAGDNLTFFYNLTNSSGVNHTITGSISLRFVPTAAHPQ